MVHHSGIYGGGEINKPNNTVLRPDTKLQEACESLRDYVDNINKSPLIVAGIGGVHARNAQDIKTVHVDGVEIGYRILEFTTFIRREIFIKVPNYHINDLSKQDREKIMAAVFNVFLVPGADKPEIKQIAPDCMRLRQNIIPMVLVERNPRLRSIAGGIG